MPRTCRCSTANGTDGETFLSHSDEVTLLGAQGGVIHGWTEAANRFERTAAGYGRGGGGIRSSRQNIATWLGQDLACLVDIEKHEGHLEGEAQPVTFLYRTTHVLRREDGAWKVILRHADPLTDFRGPQFAHAKATVSKPLSEGPPAEGGPTRRLHDP